MYCGMQYYACHRCHTAYTAYQAQSLVFADEVQQNIKKTTYTADKLTVDWGNAGYELTDGVWKVTFNNQYESG